MVIDVINKNFFLSVPKIDFRGDSIAPKNIKLI